MILFLLELSSTSNVFFIEEGTDFLTEIKFGDGVLGRKLKTGNIVIIDYNVCSGVLGNGANNFAVATTAGGYSTVTLVTNDKAEGGSDEESINSIRFNAPRHYNTQNRAVTTDDYKRIVLRDYIHATEEIERQIRQLQLEKKELDRQLHQLKRKMRQNSSLLYN